MLSHDDDDDLLEWSEEEPLAEPVLSLAQVALGWTVLVPTTVYLTDNSSSGVVGLLYPDGEFLAKSPSRVSLELDAEDEWYQPITLTTVWDGASPEPISETPIGFEDQAQSQPIYQGHTKGLLLGDYAKRVVLPFERRPPQMERLDQQRGKRERPQTWGSTYNQMSSLEQRNAELNEGGYFAA